MFFFKRKKPDPVDEPQLENNRAHYRRELENAECFIVRLDAPDREPCRGDLCDLTIRGVGVRFNMAEDPGLEVDEVVELTLCNREKGWSVNTPVRVRHIRDDEDGKLHGFEFINTGKLYTQLENSFVKIFNRRERPRVQPHLDLFLPCFMEYERIVVKGSIHDISSRGIGIVLSRTETLKFAAGSEVTVRFQLPGHPQDIKGTGFIRHSTPLPDRELIGVEFDLSKPDGVLEDQNLISEFVISRMEQLMLWERSWSD